MARQTFVAVALLMAGIVGLTETRAFDRWYAARRVGAGIGVGYGMAAYGAGYGYGGGTTAFSAMQDAQANTIRAQGEYNQMQAAAMVNYEDARSKYIDNQQKWTQVYLERKRAGEAQRAQDAEAARAVRERGKEFAADHPAPSPTRLASSQLDPATGRIQWPTALAAGAFAEQRRLVDNLFELRARTSTTPDTAAKIDKAVRTMKDTLRTQVRDIPSQDYIDARKFLDSLVVEGRSSAG